MTQTDQLDLFDRIQPLYRGEKRETIQDSFERFHEANPWVAETLLRLARDLKASGHTHIGIGMLFEVIRWQYYRRTQDVSGFKLNNNYRSRYARMLMEKAPELDGLFELRELKAQ